MRLKTRLRHSLLIICAVIIASTSVASLFTNFAYAADKTPEQDAQAYIYMRALKTCILNNQVADIDGTWHGDTGKPYITPSHADDGTWFWFDQIDQWSTRVVYTPGGGAKDCSDKGWITSMVSLFGWSDGQHALIDLGFHTGKNGNYYMTKDGESYSSAEKRNSAAIPGMLSKKWGKTLNDGMLKQAGGYWLYNKILVDQCGAKLSSSSSPPIAGHSIKAKMVDSSGKITEVTYNISKEPGSKVPVWATGESQSSHHNAYSTMSCEQIANGMSAAAPAMSVYAKKHPGSTSSDSDDSNGKSTCQVEGIGWIVCPVMNFMAKIVDSAYDVVSNMLTVNAFTTQDSDLESTWSAFRNVANIAFVIAFLIIIYSQITGIGLSNYGIKKMLPRLIISAVLVNVSYWLCAIAVDLSNIIGSAMKTFIESGGGASFAKSANNAGDAANGQGWVGIVGGVLAATTVAVAVLYIGLAALVPALIAALVAIVTVLLVLTLRQALIVLLIVVSPLAFVAYLLPNTESWFKKWKDLFQTLLLMYPIIGAIFGASALASKIVMNSAPAAHGGDNSSTAIHIAIQIMGALIAILPLAITPVIMKSAGGVLNRFGGFINNPNKGPFDRMKKSAQGYADYRKDVNRGNRISRANGLLKGKGKGLGGEYSRRRRIASFIAGAGTVQSINTEQKRKFTKAVADESGQEYFAERALNDSSFASDIAGEGKAEALRASAQGSVDKIMQQDAANREVLYTANVKIRNNPEEELKKALEQNDTIGIRALGSMLMKGGSSGYDKFNEAVQNFQDSNVDATMKQKSTDDLRKFVSDNGRDFIAKDPAMVKWSKGAYDTKDANGNITHEASLKEAVSQSNSVDRTDEEVAKITSGSMRRAAQSGSISAEQARAILSNPDTAKSANRDNHQILRAIIANNGQRISANSPDELKQAINNLAGSAPTVEQLQKAFQQATPSTSQTTQNTAQTGNNNSGGSPGGFTQRQSGLYVPHERNDNDQ